MDAFLQLNDSIEDIIFHHMTLSVVRDPPQAKRVGIAENQILNICFNDAVHIATVQFKES